MIRFTLIALCAAVTVGFGALAALPWITRTPSAAVSPVVADEQTESAPLTFPMPPATDFTTFTDRPLFAAVRRPPPPEAPGLPLSDPDADLLFGAYEITGVVMLGDNAVAMLRSKDGQLIRIRAGDEIETTEGIAVLTKITLNTLTFQRGADTVAASVEREGAQEQ